MNYRQKKQSLGQQHLPTSLGRSTQGIARFMRELRKLTDTTLLQLWRDAPAALSDYACLCAVGGYGRDELFPYSDIDILVLVDADLNEDQTQALAAFLTSCWDAGLEIASSVRTPQECAQESLRDHTIQTSLLDARCITGKNALWMAFQSHYRNSFQLGAFVNAKISEMQQRHEKHQNTPYELEPNCKESPGALRDVHLIHWLCKAGGWLDSCWEDLLPHGLATIHEIRALKRNTARISIIRAHLHLAAKRREDRLIFDLQQPLAETLGFAHGYDALKANQRKTLLRNAIRPSEALMREYYWAAKAINQLSIIIVLNIQNLLQSGGKTPELQQTMAQKSRTAIEPAGHFFNTDGMLDIIDAQLYERQPRLILETFYYFQIAPGIQGLSATTLRALYHARGLMNASFRKDAHNRKTFLRILQADQGITHAMRLMNQTSVLGRYLWPFRRIVGQMQHDLFHVYTVDQHILMVLRNVRRFFLDEHAHELPNCSQLASSWHQPWVLYIAALFHDIAKGRGGDHSELGAKEVRTFCRQHGIDKTQSDLIAFLVEQHLTMSAVAQKQDLSDPQVIARFAQTVGNARYLTALYLLTVADIRGTSPKVWSAWKGQLLDNLYRQTLRHLAAEAGIQPQSQLSERKREALAHPLLLQLAHGGHEAFWAQQDATYFLRHSSEEIAWHTQHLAPLYAHEGTNRSPAGFVFARPCAWAQGLQVLVHTLDRKDLFARICAYFDQAEYDILDAKIYTSSHSWVINSFQISAHESLQQQSSELQHLESSLLSYLQQANPLPAPLYARSSRRVRHFPLTARVHLSHDAASHHCLLGIVCADRIGLLYRIAKVFAQLGINLQSAKIVTLGERAEDSFLLSDTQLQSTEQRIALERALLNALSD